MASPNWAADQCQGRQEARIAFDEADGVWQCAPMKARVSSGVWAVLIGLFLAAGVARATTFLTFQSTYLGNGWFQYQMNVMDDPFFTEADITGVSLNFTSQIDQVAGTNDWVYQGSDGWEFTNGYPARPYSETFLVQSSYTSYRLGSATNMDGAVVLLSLELSGFYPGIAEGTISQNIVGYANLPCLIPCSPEAADGSPTNLVFNLKLVPDVEINELIQTNGEFYGVDFDWASSATFLLQGSPNLSAWTNIAYIWGDPPETVWTTNTPLNPDGQFFRIELVSDGHQTNLPPLNAATPAPKAVTNPKLAPVALKVTGCQLVGNQIAVKVAAQTGQSVQVQAINRRGTVLQSQRLVASKSSVTASFDSASLPTPVFFQAVAAP